MYIKVNEKNFKIKNCTKFKDRLIGMMFKRKKLGYGFLFENCNSIHTFFMFQNIDVFMTDKDNRVIYIYKNLKPNKIIFPKKKVKYVYEFSTSTIKNININDYIEKSP